MTMDRAYDGPDTSIYSNERSRHDATPLGTPGRPRLTQILNAYDTLKNSPPTGEARGA